MAKSTNVLAKILDALRRDRRLAGIVHGGFSGLISKGTALLVLAVTLPLMVRYLGVLEYGIWITVSTIVLMFSVMDLGISSALTNFIAEAHSNDDRVEARAYFSSAFAVSVALSLLLAVACLSGWGLINWRALFGLHNDRLVEQASQCVGIAVGFFLVNLPLSLASRVLIGYQQVGVSNYFAMLNSLLGLFAILGSVAAGLSIVGVMVCYCISLLAGTAILNFWLVVQSRPWIRPSLHFAQSVYAKNLFGQGLLFFVLQIAGLVVFNSDNLVIAHYLSPSEVTPYSVSWQLVGCASMLHSLLLPSLWPAFSDAYHRGDLAWIQTTYRRAMRATLFGVSAVAAVLALIGQAIIRVWATEAAVPRQELLWTMAVWAVLLSFTANQACLLAATRRIGLQAACSTLAAVVNLALAICLVPRIGSLGAIVATLIAYLICIVVPQSWETRNILRGKYMGSVGAF